MARMIPDTINPNTKSSAEKKLFSLLSSLPGSSDWTVIHSLGISNHICQNMGEADFIIIIPENGLFIIEVKGGIISYSDGQWYSTDRNGKTHNIHNPVEQAINARYSLIEYIHNHPSNTAKCSYIPSGYGIVCPDCDLHKKLIIPDLADETVADASDMTDLLSYFKRLAAFWNKKAGSRCVDPDSKKCKMISDMLRPEFKAKQSLSSQINYMEARSMKLTENQQDVFNGLIENARCLIRGSAGTGKTVLALNLASSVADGNKNIGLFCYNRLLASFLSEETNIYPRIYAGSFTDFMDQTVSSYYPGKSAELKETGYTNYYRNELPDLFCEVFFENNLPLFDFLILDEAQDLISEHYTDALDLILDGGLKNGNWYFFMDAEKQNLYHSPITLDDIKSEFAARNIFYTNYHLKDNCRNSVAIIRKVDSIFGTATKYHLSYDYGKEVIIRKYKSNREQAQIISSIIEEILGDDVQPDSIVILSPYKFENSACSLIDKYIIHHTGVNNGGINFHTIDRFKGLESSIIILTDIFDTNTDRKMNQLYVGMTRAKNLLYILTSEKLSRKLK